MSEILLNFPTTTKDVEPTGNKLCWMAEPYWVIKLYWHCLSNNNLNPSQFYHDGQLITVYDKGISRSVNVNYLSSDGVTIVGPGLKEVTPISFGANNSLVLDINDQPYLYALQYNGPWLRRPFRIHKIESSINAFLEFSQDAVLGSNVSHSELFLERTLLFKLLSELSASGQTTVDWLHEMFDILRLK